MLGGLSQSGWSKRTMKRVGVTLSRLNGYSACQTSRMRTVKIQHPRKTTWLWWTSCNPCTLEEETGNL